MVKNSKWTKALGSVSKVIAVLPDTTQIIGKAIDNTRPIIEKELDRHNDRKTAYIELNNVIHLDFEDAKEILENQGFLVRGITVNPNVKYANAPLNQVVRMYPRTKKAKVGSLVKLYYTDQEVVNASYILAEEQREKNEQLGQKVVDTVTGVKSVFKQKKTPKDVTPPGGK